MHLIASIPETRKRTLRNVTPLPEMQIEVDGKRYINFSSNDYFGLTHHPDVITASQSAAAKYGAGAGASRLVTGNHPLYSQLESQLAEMKGTQAALIYGSGYLANIGVISSLITRDDVILADKLIHACMIDGAKLSGATLRRFAHNDMAALEARLKDYAGQGKRTFILTETIFSMDGDIAPIAQMLKLCDQYEATLISDDAHGLEILAPQPHSRHIQIGTLSKAAAAYGGYVCCSTEVRDTLINHSRSLIFSTALPPTILAAASAGLKLIKADVSLREQLFTNICHCEEVHGADELLSPIMPIILGSDEAALSAQSQLAQAGFWVSAIRPPTVPEGSSRLRVTLSAAHKAEDVKRLATLIADIQSEAACSAG